MYVGRSIILQNVQWLPLQNHPSGHPGGWAILLLAEEMLVGCLYPCQDCCKWSFAEKTGRGSLLNHLSCSSPFPHPPTPSDRQWVKELNQTELKHWYGCQCPRFLRCTQMLMHAIEHRGLYEHGLRLHWKLILGEKSLAIAQGVEPVSATCQTRCSTSWAVSLPRVQVWLYLAHLSHQKCCMDTVFVICLRETLK